MGQKLFEYTVIFTPIRTKDQVEAGEQAKSVLIVPVTAILANTESEAQLQAARAIPTEYADKLAQCEIAVRAF